MKMEFNPNEEVTIYNPLPQRYWPYVEGTIVYFIACSGQICEGRVRWFQPAFHSSCVVTKGNPTFTIDCFEGGSYLVCIDHVRKKSSAGYYELTLKIAARWEARVDQLDRDAKDARKNFESALTFSRNCMPKNYVPIPKPKLISLRELKRRRFR